MNLSLYSSISKFNKYLQARFPFLPLSLFTFLTILGINSTSKTLNLQKTVFLSTVYLLFLFNLRILDEFKDYSYDSKYHSDRPVQSGLVSLSFLKILGILNLAIIIFLGFIASSPKTIILLLITLGYTILMFKEFFISSLLRKKMLLYLISHELVFIPLFIFFYSSLNNNFWLPDNTSKLSHLFYTIIPIILIEIGRKLKHRYNSKGQKTNDTYAYLWGEKNSIRVFVIILLFSGILSCFIAGFNNYLSLVIITSSFIIFVGSFLFHQFIINKSMAITSLLALSLPIFLLL